MRWPLQLPPSTTAFMIILCLTPMTQSWTVGYGALKKAFLVRAIQTFCASSYCPPSPQFDYQPCLTQSGNLLGRLFLCDLSCPTQFTGPSVRPCIIQDDCCCLHQKIPTRFGLNSKEYCYLVYQEAQICCRSEAKWIWGSIIS